ncbi:hypothetical protein LTS18_006298 [Coniosporium uncinatum]|uniref:Uncharacterized protein n=1 Tax=Coniosporium uncinatum TaxID=93489 RepID=A0ACC3DXD7_9PEZI|nr:hypothetical protein LTS18_006298 [Coniosporium uncinatum]
MCRIDRTEYVYPSGQIRTVEQDHFCIYSDGKTYCPDVRRRDMGRVQAGAESSPRGSNIGIVHGGYSPQTSPSFPPTPASNASVSSVTANVEYREPSHLHRRSSMREPGQAHRKKQYDRVTFDLHRKNKKAGRRESRHRRGQSYDSVRTDGPSVSSAESVADVPITSAGPSCHDILREPRPATVPPPPPYNPGPGPNPSTSVPESPTGQRHRRPRPNPLPPIITDDRHALPSSSNLESRNPRRYSASEEPIQSAFATDNDAARYIAREQLRREDRERRQREDQRRRQREREEKERREEEAARLENSRIDARAEIREQTRLRREREEREAKERQEQDEARQHRADRPRQEGEARRRHDEQQRRRQREDRCRYDQSRRSPEDAESHRRRRAVEAQMAQERAQAASLEHEIRTRDEAYYDPYGNVPPPPTGPTYGPPHCPTGYDRTAAGPSARTPTTPGVSARRPVERREPRMPERASPSHPYRSPRESWAMDPEERRARGPEVLARARASQTTRALNGALGGGQHDDDDDDEDLYGMR